MNNNVSLKDKLVMIREGYSLEDIDKYMSDSLSKGFNNIFLESINSDVDYVAEITLETNGEEKQNKTNASVDYGKNKAINTMD